MIDQRALDKATAALADYIRHNPPLQFMNPTTKQIDSIINIAHAKACVEAYEAAKPDPWRPIEEAPRDGTQFLVWLKVDAYPKQHLLHWDSYDREFHDVTGMCWSEHGDVVNGAMFRTIDPPMAAQSPQDDHQEATEGQNNVA